MRLSRLRFRPRLSPVLLCQPQALRRARAVCCEPRALPALSSLLAQTEHLLGVQCFGVLQGRHHVYFSAALEQCYHTRKNFRKQRLSLACWFGFFFPIAWESACGNLDSSVPEGYPRAAHQVVLLFLLLNSSSFLILNIPFFCLEG